MNIFSLKRFIPIFASVFLWLPTQLYSQCPKMFFPLGWPPEMEFSRDKPHVTWPVNQTTAVLALQGGTDIRLTSSDTDVVKVLPTGGDGDYYPNWRAETLSEGTATISVEQPGCPVMLNVEVTVASIAKPDENNILYVRKGAFGDGRSWRYAFPELRDVLNWAQENWDAETNGTLQIWVAEGTYTPAVPGDPANVTTDEREATFQLINGVEIYGGFAGNESSLDDRNDWEANPTILSGDIDQNDEAFDPEGDSDNNPDTSPQTDHIRGSNSYSVVNGLGTDGTAMLDGFTITGGNADDTEANLTSHQRNGGGIYNDGGSPTLTNLLITGNHGTDGGGAYNVNNSSPRMVNVTIFGNSAIRGGGMYNSSSSPLLTNVTISGNSAVYGGGVYNHTSSPVLTNVVISGNDAGDSGPEWLNESGIPIIRNSVIWGKGVSGILYDAQYSLIEGQTEDNNGAYFNATNHNLDPSTNPLFVDPDNGDFRLKAGSPAINVGSNAAYEAADGDTENGSLDGDLDIDGQPRVQGGTIDLGAYESPYDNLVSVEDDDGEEAITVDFGTLLSEVPLPEGYTVTGALTSGTTVKVTVDDDTDNWVLVDADEDDDYDGNIAGDYVFEVPLILPDPEDEDSNWFSNTQGLKTHIAVTVAKGTPELTVAWDGTALDPTEGLSLTYGDVGELVGTSTDPDGAVTFTVNDGEEEILDPTNPEETAAGLAGTATLTIVQEETANYEAASLSLEVTVAPKGITIVPTAGQGKVYGKADPDTYGYELAEGETLAFDDELTDIVSATAREAGEDVGEYDITLTLEGEKAGNYAVTFDAENEAFTITPATVEGITLSGGSVEYDGEAHSLEISGTLPTGVTVSYTINGEPGNSATDADSYQVVATVSGDNYETLVLEAVLEITPATVEGIALSGGSVEYDGEAHSLEISGTLPAGVTVSYTINGEPGNSATDADSYQVVATVSGDNYETLVLEAVLEITPATVEGITLSGGSVEYDGEAHSLEISGTLPTGVTVSYTINGEPGNSATDAGSYEVVATLSGDNYETLELRATLTITTADEPDPEPQPDPDPEPQPVPVTGITLNDATFTYDGMPKSLTIAGALPEGASVSYTIDGQAGNSATDAGSYELVATISGEGYETLVLTATLTVTQATQTITFAEVGELRRDAGTIPLSVSATSGLPVELTIDDEEVATLSGTSLNVLRLGTVRITATQAGDANHEAAEPVTVTVRVTDPTADLPVRVQQAVSPNGDGINDYLIIEAIKDYPDNRVRIFNRNGTVVWEGSGYNNGTVAFRGIGVGQQHVPAGTYFYVAEIRVGNEWKYEKGWFVLRY